ncbi:MAG: hypothetical protein AAF934_05780, partial [Bacteroidota bacterium]
VEPVLGTLKEFMSLRKVNTIGIKQANKGRHLAATAYNLNKYLNFTQKRIKSHAGVMSEAFLAIKWRLKLKISPSCGQTGLLRKIYHSIIKSIGAELNLLNGRYFVCLNL